MRWSAIDDKLGWNQIQFAGDGISVADNKPAADSTPKIENIGQPRSTISVEISARFLGHFSEQLYSSPQKAFKELISNGWDAGANRVDVRISPELKTDNSATMAVLDNGASMNEEGLRQLWHIAFSPKRGKDKEYGRPIREIRNCETLSPLNVFPKPTQKKWRLTPAFARVNRPLSPP
jgi:hypothetical protein